MKFTGEHYGHSVSVEYDHDDVMLDEAIVAVVSLLQLMTYQNVEETLREMYGNEV